MWTRITRTIALSLLLFWQLADKGFAQGPTPTGIVVASCGGSSLTAGAPYYLTIDTTGKLCGIVTAPSSGLVVTTAACSGTTCYTSPVNTGATVISAVSTSNVIFSATTSIDPGSFCNNTNASARTLTVTDGNGKNVIGPAFSIPGLSQNSFDNIKGTIFDSGIKIAASAAGDVYCWIRGHQ